MQRAWLFFVAITLFVIALGTNAPVRVNATDSGFIVKRIAAGVQVTATITLPPAIATAIPTTTPAREIIGEGSNMTFMIALLVIAGGAVLLWRRQRNG